MSPQTLGILIGGILSSLVFGICGVFVKASTNAGIGVGPYLVAASVGVLTTGLVFLLLTPDTRISVQAGGFAFLVGATWALGAGLVTIGIAKYGVPLSTIVPLYNTNTLITVLLALLIFAEWRQVQVAPLLLGSLLIILGSTLVARA